MTDFAASTISLLLRRIPSLSSTKRSPSSNSILILSRSPLLLFSSLIFSPFHHLLILLLGQLVHRRCGRAWNADSSSTWYENNRSLFMFGLSVCSFSCSSHFLLLTSCSLLLTHLPLFSPLLLLPTLLLPDETQRNMRMI